jgi:serine acetyltransferase/acyl carrier protein
MARRLFLCGAGNPEGVRLAIRANQAADRWDEIVLLDDDPCVGGRACLGVVVVGGFDHLALHDPTRSEVVNLVARTTAGRQKARDRIAGFGVPFTGIISADVDTLGAEVAPDVLVYPNATIGPEAAVGAGSVVFMGAAVGHECLVGAHCVIAANSVLNARVRLGDGVYVGSGAVVLPEVEVGAGATIGAGAVVLADVPAGATVAPPRSDVLRRGGATPPAVPPEKVAGALTVLWAEVLGAARVRPEQNFFDLGGNSLLAMRLIQRIEETLGVTLGAVDLFQYPTVSALAARLGASRPGMAAPVLDQALSRAERRRQVQAWRGAGQEVALQVPVPG